MEAKPRILYLLKILLERTDEEHPLSTTQLIGILNEKYGGDDSKGFSPEYKFKIKVYILELTIL